MAVDTVNVSESPAAPLAAQPIQWAGVSSEVSADLEARFDAMRRSNWVTDRMVEQYQKHWHCTRGQALERLLAKAGA